MKRPLFCPICGAKVMVELASTIMPEIHRIPEHEPAINVNLCQGLVVTVKIGLDRCGECGCKMSKHPSGLCQRCFADEK